MPPAVAAGPTAAARPWRDPHTAGIRCRDGAPTTIPPLAGSQPARDLPPWRRARYGPWRLASRDLGHAADERDQVRRERRPLTRIAPSRRRCQRQRVIVAESHRGFLSTASAAKGWS